MRIYIVLIFVFLLADSAFATTRYVRSDGSTTTNCTGTTNAAYLGSGIGQACAFSNLQDALNASVGGDIISVKAGDTFNSSSGFLLPIHSGASYVTIQSSAIASLSSGRISPSDSSNLPKIQTTDNSSGSPTFTLVDGAEYWKLDGLEVTNNTTIQINVMIALNNTDATKGHLIINRLLMHPKECPNLIPPYNTTGRFAIQANLLDFTGTNNYIQCFYGLPPGGVTGNTAVDTMAFVSDGGPLNPGLIQNNYIETWYQMGIFGGADATATNIKTVSGTPTLTTATVSDTIGLVIGDPIAFAVPWELNFCKNPNTRTCYGDGFITNIAGNNLTFTPLTCNAAGGSARVACDTTQAPLVPGEAKAHGVVVSNLTIDKNDVVLNSAFSDWILSNNGNHPKGYLEIKVCDTCTITGNIFEGFAAGGVLNFESTNQNGGMPWAIVRNITVRNNWFKEFSHFNISCTDAYYLSTNAGNFNIDNNLLTSPDRTSSASHPGGLVAEGRDCKAPISFTHNSILAGYPTTQQKAFSWSISDGTAPSGIVTRDNLIGWGNFGFTCNTGGFTIGDCWPSKVEDHNIFVLTENPPNTSVASQFPNSATTPGTSASWAAALLIGTCDKNNIIDNCGLQFGSLGHHAASDGTDIGVNINNLKSGLGLLPIICNWNTNPTCN